MPRKKSVVTPARVATLEHMDWSQATAPHLPLRHSDSPLPAPFSSSPLCLYTLASAVYPVQMHWLDRFDQ